MGSPKRNTFNFFFFIEWDTKIVKISKKTKTFHLILDLENWIEMNCSKGPEEKSLMK